MRNLFLAMIGGAVMLVGCADIKLDQVNQQEQDLSAAGFQIKYADTPAKMSHLQDLPQHKLMAQDVNGTPRFYYADARFCRCLFAGDEGAYQTLLHDRQQREIAQMEQDAAEMDWGMWGPWGPYGW